MEIRRLREQDFDANIALAEYAFLYQLTEQQKEERRSRFANEEIWGVFEDNELCAKLALLPLEVYIHGRKVRMGGIAGVSTWPEKRRQGMVSKLLRRALEEMRASGQLLSYLHPFSIPFYRKYGWELFTDNKNYLIPVEKLPTRRGVPGRVIREVRDIEVLAAIYDRAIPAYNGPLVRTSSWWEQRVMNGTPYTAVYYNEAGEAEGYVLYAIENRVWITEEMIWVNETARLGLWDFIVNHDSKLKEVQLKMPSDDPLSLLLPDPKVKQELEPYFMARIVDAAEFMKVYPFTALGVSTSFNLRIEDRDAPWNEGIWNWTIAPDGKAKLEPAQDADPDNAEAPTISVSIGILTAMLLGYHHPSTLWRCGLLKTSESAAQQLDTLIPARTPYLPDYF
ncbi:hypothetical protein B9G55_16320 [Saccharibacillus sp. O16]|nr:hypothetical protein B9G55_16320 [Saccharibacillus sp. O16]